MTMRWLPVQFASRTLNDAEKRYSQIEREGLSIVYACERFRKLLLGCNFIFLRSGMTIVLSLDYFLVITLYQSIVHQEFKDGR